MLKNHSNPAYLASDTKFLLTYNSRYKMICTKKLQRKGISIPTNLSLTTFKQITFNITHRQNCTTRSSECSLTNVGVCLKAWSAIQAVTQEKPGIKGKHGIYEQYGHSHPATFLDCQWCREDSNSTKYIYTCLHHKSQVHQMFVIYKMLYLYK